MLPICITVLHVLSCFVLCCCDNLPFYLVRQPSLFILCIGGCLFGFKKEQTSCGYMSYCKNAALLTNTLSLQAHELRQYRFIQMPPYKLVRQVTSTKPGYLAAAHGLKVGDIILVMNGRLLFSDSTDGCGKERIGCRTTLFRKTRTKEGYSLYCRVATPECCRRCCLNSVIILGDSSNSWFCSQDIGQQHDVGMAENTDKP